MARLYNNFEFIGHINIAKNKDKFYKIDSYDSGWEKHTLNFAVKESNTNSAFVELQGGYSKVKPNKVVTFGKGTENVKGSKLEIPWDDRLKDETVEMVADFKKVVVDFTIDKELKEKLNQLRYEIRTLEFKDKLTPDEQEKLTSLRKEYKEKAVDRYEFIHPYDAINMLSNKLENYKEFKFRVTGNVIMSAWKGKFYRRFEADLIEIVEDDTPSQLRATIDVFFTKDSVDNKDFKKDKKVYIEGYVMDYDNQSKKDVFFPMQFVINAQKVDFENEMHVKRFEYLKNKFSIKKGVHHLQWTVNIFRGADKVEFTEKDLTPAQKEAIEFGYNKLEDFAPKGGMLGDSVYENRLVKPNLQKVNDDNDFTNGAIESDYKEEDLDYVYVQPETKKEEVKESVTETKKPEVDLEDLFA
ncbi:hypothetical protein AB1283_01030 [Bacillus sp. S13(2024)]|uniref:hypothetical protein n=1 Tax=Bacillus sp. S13(2024) TaxID=3162885 RepID=UPI003D1DB397